MDHQRKQQQGQIAVVVVAAVVVLLLLLLEGVVVVVVEAWTCLKIESGLQGGVGWGVKEEQDEWN